MRYFPTRIARKFCLKHKVQDRCWSRGLRWSMKPTIFATTAEQRRRFIAGIVGVVDRTEMY